MVEPAPLAFVCGHPIAHSRSPQIHRFWLRQYGVAGSYEAIDVAPADFGAFLRDLNTSGLVGGNVTIPHKEAAFAAIAKHDHAAEAIGAVNTLWFELGVLVGGNTDAYGFTVNLDDNAPDWHRKGGAAVVLGAGGAARAVVHALLERGISDIRIANRTLSRATELTYRFGVGRVSAHSWDALPEILYNSTLLVNTTSVGMTGKDAAAIDISPLSDRALVTDIVYAPLQTPLLIAAQQRGLGTVDGLGMLLHQAAPGFEKWFGVCPSVNSELRLTVANDIPAT